MDKSMTYTEAMKRLEEIMTKIQSGDVDIDNLTKELADAQELIAFCRNRIFKVEEDVKNIIDSLSQE
ncbi:MAG: exodeoxyribonuclease VII small subunit [Bacteroidaceae bacterium]|nr:exodeoxyribonuclease VII small subunit [Bacteroidaceae bacterium]